MSETKSYVCSGTAGNEAKVPSWVSGSGAGSVNPPVLYKCEADFMIPELPICKTDELEIPPILKTFI
jgi:hypothetical protein